MRLASGAVAAALCALLGPSVFAHGFHTTRTEAHYRPERGTLEVSLLVADDDLRRALSKVAPRAGLSDAAIAKWLAGAFRVESAGGALPLRWVGKERERRGHWLHFEVLEVDRLDGKTLVHEVLLETEPFALHTVKLIRPGAPAVVVTLDRGERRLPLGEPPPLSRNVKDDQESPSP